jgi:hypothetical protein
VVEAEAVVFARIPRVEMGDRLAEWNHWYDTVHIPRRLQVPGVHAAHRFSVVAGDLASLAFYEANPAGAFAHADYGRLREHEAAMASSSWEKITGAIPGFARSPYLINGTRPFSEFADVSVLGAVGLDLPVGGRAACRTAAFGLLDELIVSVPGAERGWLLTLASPQQVPMSGTPATSPHVVAMVDLGRRSGSTGDLLRALRAADLPVGATGQFWLAAERQYPAPR